MLKKPQVYIPRLCRNSSLLLILIVVLLVAIAGALLVPQGDFVSRAGNIAVYLIWCVLPATGLLCLLRGKINNSKVIPALGMALVCCMVPFLCVEIAWQSFASTNLDLVQLIQKSVAALIIVLALLRIFSLLGLLEYRSMVEANARFDALQSKIRPHFLFNSLNTIAELTHQQPERAEQALLSLSMLFRASLESGKKWSSLDAEVNLCRRYLELEQWRLGDKLSYQENVDIALAQEWQLPRLILQPLIENAVLHGAKADGGVDMSLEVKETKAHLSILVINALGDGVHSKRKGAGMAVENIKERLLTLYDDQASFRATLQGNEFKVFIKLPKLRANEVPV
jgi:two-component system sensor histidine kinase AlgZ